MLCLLAACLLLAASGMTRSAAAKSAVALPGSTGTLYRPAAVDGFTLPAHDEDGHGGSGHEETVTLGTRGPAVLILHRGADGAETLALELARRGTAALVIGEGVSPRDAWDWLFSRDFVSAGAVGLAAGGARCAEALALAGELSGSGRECAAVMLLGGAGILRPAADSPARNILALTAGTDRSAELAFYGSESAADRGFTGYFGDGTARAAAAVPGFGGFARREILSRLMEWQGSSLGHRIELHDDDLTAGSVPACRAAAAACFLAAAASLLLRKKFAL